jgi:hypothetical protein
LKAGARWFRGGERVEGVVAVKYVIVGKMGMEMDIYCG